MNGNDNGTSSVCPCGEFVHPQTISNPPGRTLISYRVGDYATFLRALLQGRAGETELSTSANGQQVQVWRPSARGDLALQMVEWWAYLADVMTFYNERIATQAYLRTADLPESVNRLIHLLGYRPRPGIGATGTLAALANGPQPFVVPQGLQIQSKPGPGKPPQIFEVLTDTPVGQLATGAPTGPQGSVQADAVPGSAQLAPVADQTGGVSVFLAGASSAVKSGDRVLILRQSPPPGSSTEPPFVVAAITAVSQEKDARNKPVTRLCFAASGAVMKIADVTAYIVRTTDQATGVYPYVSDDTNVLNPSGGSVDLAAITRQIKVGDQILMEEVDAGGSVVAQAAKANSGSALPRGKFNRQGAGLAALAQSRKLAAQSKPVAPLDATSSAPQLVTVTAYTEVIYYANNPSDPTDPPTGKDADHPPAAIPILHSRLGFAPLTGSGWDRNKLSIRYGWKDVGALIPAATAAVLASGASTDGTATATMLQPGGGAGSFPTVAAATPVLVEDAVGNGSAATLFPANGSDASPTLVLSDPVPTLYPPFEVLFNLLPVTRGKTVANEVLGSGNAAVGGQDFVLQNAPVTYLQDPASVSGDNYSSTVRVWINGLQWSEVRGFYGQGPDARVFVTREDEQGKTHVVFGDGVNGARLPTGVSVTAAYRYGSGAGAPAAGSLTVILQPQPGLKAVVNPVQVGGGSEPDLPAKIRRLAPRSVLTFNRAVSADDYETIAAQAPGVTRAKASFGFDPAEQRPRVQLWVGDDAGAVQAARAALASTADPNRLPAIALAKAVTVTLNMTLVLDPRYVAATVLGGAQTALLDPDTGLLGLNVLGIGQALYDSQVYAACLAVPGVLAVRDYVFSAVGSTFRRSRAPRRPRPPGSSPVECECEHRHDPGEGNYFYVPDDGQHLNLATLPSR